MTLKQLFVENQFSGRAGNMPCLLVEVRRVCAVLVACAGRADAAPAADAMGEPIADGVNARKPRVLWQTAQQVRDGVLRERGPQGFACGRTGDLAWIGHLWES